MRVFRSILGVLLFTTAVASADSGAETIKALFNRPLFAQPVSTILGTATNAGWFRSATVEKEFTWGISLPVSLIYINKKDRYYSDTFTDDGCVECRQQAVTDPQINCNDCIECRDYDAPTLFGTMATPRLYRSIRDLHNNIFDSIPVDPPFTNGVKEVAKYSVVPFATLQVSVAYAHTALMVRYIGIPKIEGFSFQFPAVGIQHDFSRFVPDLPVTLSAAATVSFLNASWTVSDVDDVEGTLKLSGISNFIGVLAGYRFPYLELFLETGWEHSYLKPGGPLKVRGELLEAQKAIPGRNGFKVALNAALPLTYAPVVGVVGGAQFANVINLLSFWSKPQ